MMSFASARVVVIVDRNSGGPLIQSLARMGIAGVLAVASVEEAQLLCEAQRADVCLVVVPGAVPDEVPPWSEETAAPGRVAGVPSLLVTDVVTPHVAKAARSSGYFGAVPARLPPRLLYRWMRALLQRRRALASGRQDPVRTASAMIGVAQAVSSDAWTTAKLKLQ